MEHVAIDYAGSEQTDGCLYYYGMKESAMLAEENDTIQSMGMGKGRYAFWVRWLTGRALRNETARH